MNLLVLRFLTLNNDDEKRDQREQKLAARGFVSRGAILASKNSQNLAFFGFKKEPKSLTNF
jgi:hypothetical protein